MRRMVGSNRHAKNPCLRDLEPVCGHHGGVSAEESLDLPIAWEQALAGFQRLGLRRAFLEVTADNKPAVRLYHRLGFRTVRTIYKTVDSPGRAADQVGHRSQPALL